jgi:dienelactone hydrolase
MLRLTLGNVLPAIVLLLAAGPTWAQKDKTDLEAHAVKQAGEFVRLMTTAQYDCAAGYFGGQMAEVMDAKKLKIIWESLADKYGPFQECGPPEVSHGERFTNVAYEGVWANERLRIRVVIDEGGWVGGLWFEPAKPPPYKEPKYVNRKKFTEQDVTIGKAPWALPGTLSLPKAKSKVPGVVLVHGSGPNDRDELVGACRPFRDLAWGLANQNIAVLRYDKRTFTHGKKMIECPDQDTLEAEVIDDAIAAIELLRARPEVNGKKVYLLGHSLGGMCTPEIALRDGKLAGAIMMAAPARDTETIVAEQFKFQASIAGTKPDELIAKLQALAERKVDPDEGFLGARARYWYHVMGRDGQAVVDKAKTLTCRVLLLQGANDCQITRADYDVWSSAMKDMPNARLEWLDGLNHLFVAVAEPSTGAEYFEPGHVDRRVIDMIAKWIDER